MSVPDYKINYKSDFVLNINGDAGWAIPFCIKFWTGMPSQAYFVGFDGVKYVNCKVGDTPTQLLVMFDDHHLPIGKLKMQIAYHTTIEEFPGSVFDEVTNARDVIVTIDGTDYQVLLDFTGEDAPELEFNLPAYANEAERIQNELQRQQNEAARIEAELEREQASAAAVAGAENVNAQLNGNILTVTNRNGVSTSVNTKGDTGAQGPQGEQGEQGPQGAQGPQGPQGVKGETGAIGATGPQGPTGPTGTSITGFVYKSETTTHVVYTVTYSNGNTSEVSIPKGEQGETGPQGPEGPEGPTGTSIVSFTYSSETTTDVIYTVTYSNGNTSEVSIPKGPQGNQGPQGPQGEKGDTVILGDGTNYTLYNIPGQNTDGAMTQKSTTDEIYGNTLVLDDYEYDLGEQILYSIVQDAWKANASGTGNGQKCHIIPVVAGEYFRIVGRTTDSNTSPYAWLTSNSHVAGQTPSYLTGYAGQIVIQPNETVVIKVPDGASYLYIARVINSNGRLPSSVRLEHPVNGVVANIGTKNVDYAADTTNDLVISDENNNDIVQFRNGQIRTRRFDSAEIDLTSIGIFNFIKTKYDGLRCAIVGDSISSYESTVPSSYATYYPYGDVTNSGLMWWRIMCNTLGMTPVNCSWSGSRVTGEPKGTTAYAGCSDMRVTDMGRDGNPDIVIFLIGCNDWGHEVALCANNWSIDDQVINDSQWSSTDTLELFCEAYSLMLYKTKIAYPHSRLFCCTIMDEIRRDSVGVGIFPPINDNNVSNYTWNEHIKMISEAYGCDVINMHDCGVNYFNLEQYYSVDAAQGALHPNKAGQALMAQKAISELISK